MISTRHPFFKTFKNLISEIAVSEPIYDLGTNARFAKEVGLVREIFNGKKYFAGGYEPDLKIGLDKCDFHCDLLSLENIETCSVGSLICLSVLEHVANPSTALAELSRVLKHDGLILASIPFFSGYHGKNNSPDISKITARHDAYPDFWRFTHEGLHLMFAQAGFKEIKIYPVDGPLICRLEIIGIYRYLQKIPFVGTLINKIDKPILGKITTIHFVFAKKQ